MCLVYQFYIQHVTSYFRYSRFQSCVQNNDEIQSIFDKIFFKILTIFKLLASEQNIYCHDLCYVLGIQVRIH